MGNNEKEGNPRYFINTMRELYRNTEIVSDARIELTAEILINKRVRQGCSLSQNLLNIYVDDLIFKWESRTPLDIHMGLSTYINTLLLTDDQVVIGTNEQPVHALFFV